MKPVRLSAHASSYTVKRGFTHSEVEEAIATVPWQPSEEGKGRFECAKEFAFNRHWSRKFYSTKRVRPIFVDEALEIVVVTV